MEIKINTKFNINDIVYGFYENRIYKFHIDDIIVNYRFDGFDENIQIKYDVSAIIPNSELTFGETYNEFDLYTKEEIKIIFENFLKEDEN